MDEYEIGNLARLKATFTSAETGQAIDPGTVKLEYKPEDGVLTTLTYALGQITRDGTGIYHADVSLTTAGTWRYRWSSTGNGQAASEGKFFVNEQITK